MNLQTNCKTIFIYYYPTYLTQNSTILGQCSNIKFPNKKPSNILKISKIVLSNGSFRASKTKTNYYNTFHIQTFTITIFKKRTWALHITSQLFVSFLFTQVLKLRCLSERGIARRCAGRGSRRGRRYGARESPQMLEGNSASRIARWRGDGGAAWQSARACCESGGWRDAWWCVLWSKANDERERNAIQIVPFSFVLDAVLSGDTIDILKWNKLFAEKAWMYQYPSLYQFIWLFDANERDKVLDIIRSLTDFSFLSTIILPIDWMKTVKMLPCFTSCPRGHKNLPQVFPYHSQSTYRSFMHLMRRRWGCS